MARIAGVNIPTNKRVEIAPALYPWHRAANAKDHLRKVGIASEPPRQRSDRDRSHSDPRSDRPRLRRRRRSAPRSGDEHQAADGSRLLSRPASSQGPAGPRPAHAHQRPHPQRSRQARSPARRKSTEVSMSARPWRKRRAPARRKEERRRRASRMSNATFNNTIITITDAQGNAIVLVVGRHRWASRARASRRPMPRRWPPKTPASKAVEHGMRTLEVEVSGPGSGRESALRALQAVGLTVTSIRDVTPIPHNGCRPPKRRRV